MFEKGTILHSIYRGILVFIAFGITTLMQSNPQWEIVTVGAIGSTIVHWIASNLEK